MGLRNDEIAAPRARRIEGKRLPEAALPGRWREERIAVEAQEVQILAEGGAVIQMAEEAVVEDHPLRLCLIEDLDLVTLETGCVPCKKAEVVEPVGGLAIGRAIVHRCQDLFKIRVVAGPVSGSPGRVESIERIVVFLAEKLTEGYLGGLRVILHRVAMEFIIGLPGHHRGMAAKKLGHCPGDFA